MKRAPMGIVIGDVMFKIDKNAYDKPAVLVGGQGGGFLAEIEDLRQLRTWISKAIAFVEDKAEKDPHEAEV